MKRATVVSLGAGVQSSALLLMADRGDCEFADFAVFSDTQAEPPEVYEWLDFLESKVSIPIYRTTAGDIAADALASQEPGGGKGGGRFASIPFFVTNADGSPGIARRQCTKEYKLEPVFKEVRKRLGYAPRQAMKHTVRMLIGISFDEAHRRKDPMHSWLRNSYPLVDAYRSRQWAKEYVEKALGRTPPRSACYICPFHSDDEWRAIKADPVLWQKAVDFDKAMRRQKKFDGELYLHSERVPLDQVDLTVDRRQMDLFGNECEGMCGL